LLFRKHDFLKLTGNQESADWHLEKGITITSIQIESSELNKETEKNHGKIEPLNFNLKSGLKISEFLDRLNQFQN
jgi:hypothetical protein